MKIQMEIEMQIKMKMQMQIQMQLVWDTARLEQEVLQTYALGQVRYKWKW